MPERPPIITVTLNPAIDRIIEVPNFTIGAHQPSRELARLAAGKGVNVSRTLAAFGVPSIATGFLGADNRDLFTASLRQSKIADGFLTLDGRTRENITIINPVSHLDTHLRDAGLEVSPPHLARLEQKLQSLIQPRSIVAFSGSLPPGLAADDFARLLDACMAAGARVAVDTGGEALRAAVGKPLWLVKPNRAELASVVAMPLEDDRRLFQAAADLAGHIHIVLLSAGPQGAYLFRAGAAWHAKLELEKNRLANTVGCGDALLGAFLAGVYRNADIPDALRDAVACASAAACTAVSAQFEPADMPAFRSRVQLDSMECGGNDAAS